MKTNIFNDAMGWFGLYADKRKYTIYENGPRFHTLFYLVRNNLNG